MRPAISVVAYAPFAAFSLFNNHGTGDMLQVDCASVPTRDLASLGIGTNTNWPMLAAYASRDGDRYTVFVLSRKMAHYPDTGDDGYTPCSIDLPFALDANSSITLYRMDGDYTQDYLTPDQHAIDQVNIPVSAFSSTFVIDDNTGADSRGLPPTSIFCYVFEQTVPAVLPTAPQVALTLPLGVSDPFDGDAAGEIPIEVRFDRPMHGFGNAGDVILGGSAQPARWRVEEVFGSQGSRYTLYVSDYTQAGTVAACIPAKAAQARDGGVDNAASAVFSVDIAMVTGQPLLAWNFPAEYSPDENDPVNAFGGSTTNLAPVQVSSLGIGPGLRVHGSWILNNEAGARCAESTSQDLDDYLRFELTPAEGATVNLAQLRFTYNNASSSTEQTGCAVAWSDDGFATSHAVSLSPEGPYKRNDLITGDQSTFSALQELTSPVEFRIYVWGKVSQWSRLGITALTEDGNALEVLGTGSTDGSILSLSANAQITNPQRILLRWSEDLGTSYYLLERRHTDASNQLMINLLSAGGIAYVDEQLGTLTPAEYRYDLQAFSLPAELRNEVLDIVPVDLGLSTSPSGDGILVDWSDVTDADWYLLDRKQEGADNQIMLRFLPLNPSEYLDTAVNSLNDYVYNLYAEIASVLGNG